MSVVEKIKDVSEAALEFSNEKPRLTFFSDSSFVVENYKSLKYFDDNEIVIEFLKYDLNVAGVDLVIESFNPNRITVYGLVKEIVFHKKTLEGKE